MKIVFLDAITLGNDISLEKFTQLGNIEIYQTTNENQTLDRVKNCDVVITNKVVIDKKIMKKSNIKLICISATGTNNIDLEYAKENNIEVKNVSDYSTNSVAQVTITLALTLIQKINYYKDYVNNKKWVQSDIFTHIDEKFYELNNKNWGIIGLGNIGKKVAQIAKAFGCNINYYSTSNKNTNTLYNKTTLEDLLKTSDIISIHCPLNDETLNLINKTNINTIKDGAILINVARGGIINEKDLSEAINGGKDLYCGIDVVETEPMLESNSLLKIQNKDKIIITPHIAWASIEARNELVNKVYKNVLEYKLKNK